MKDSLAPTPSLAQSLPPKLIEVLDKFEQQLRLQKKRSTETVRSYVSQATTFSEFLLLEADSKDPSIKKLFSDPQRIREHLRESSQTLNSSSQAQKVSALRCFINHLIENKLCGHDCLRPLERPRSPKKLIEIVPEDTLQFLQKALKEKRPLEEQLLFALLYGSGLRISEAANLKWKQMPRPAQESASLEILGKGKKRRVVPLTQKSVEIIQALKKDSAAEAESKVFSQGVRTLRRWVENWALLVPEAELKLHPHLLRHSLASHLLRRGAHLPEIQRLLGHSQLSTTERYTHLNVDDLVRIYDESFQQARSQKPKRKSTT